MHTDDAVASDAADIVAVDAAADTDADSFLPPSVVENCGNNHFGLVPAVGGIVLDQAVGNI